MHRIEKVQETEVYITIRNHKKSFLNKTSWYFINPSKHIVRWLSKVILNKNEQWYSERNLRQSIERHFIFDGMIC